MKNWEATAIPPGANAYLPEDYYWQSWNEEERISAILCTISYVVKWADRYELYELGRPGTTRGGSLPADLVDRQNLIRTQLASWLQRTKDNWLLALILMRGDKWLLDVDDGLPGSLFLLAHEFAELQAEWERNGFPRDLYYPESEAVVTTRVIENYGGLVRVNWRYTPLQWQDRQVNSVEDLPVTSEADRSKTFIAACNTFARALVRRRNELVEAGRDRDALELAILEKLTAAMFKLAQGLRKVTANN